MDLDSRKKLLSETLAREATFVHSLMKWLISTNVIISGGSLFATLRLIDENAGVLIAAVACFILAIVLSFGAARILGAHASTKFERMERAIWEGESLDKTYDELDSEINHGLNHSAPWSLLSLGGALFVAGAGLAAYSVFWGSAQ